MSDKAVRIRKATANRGMRATKHGSPFMPSPEVQRFITLERSTKESIERTLAAFGR